MYQTPLCDIEYTPKQLNIKTVFPAENVMINHKLIKGNEKAFPIHIITTWGKDIEDEDETSTNLSLTNPFNTVLRTTDFSIYCSKKNLFVLSSVPVSWNEEKSKSKLCDILVLSSICLLTTSIGFVFLQYF